MSVVTHVSLCAINIAAALCSAKAYNNAYAKGEQMINETMFARGAESSIIREIFSYGLERKAQIGAENVFDFLLCNPSVPAPAAVAESIKKALELPSDQLHGYTPAPGLPHCRFAVAESLNRRFGTSYEGKDVFMTVGAAASLTCTLNAVTNPGDEVIVIAPYFPEYRVWIEKAGCTCVEAPADEDTFQLSVGNVLKAITDKTAAVIIDSPNNPTGAAYTRDQLKVWVDYARKNDAIILYDAAYECFISDGDLARSIFEIEGARECAIEICSFSKIAGFTGTRCGYTVVPHELEREGMNINKLWLRRQTTKFNGVPYVVQRAAAAVFTESGMAEIQSNLDYYRRNAKVIADALDECGVWYCGGKNSPYIWLRCPGNMKSWEFFDWLLENCGVVGTPGVGFGECGEGYFRLTAFGDAEKTKVAAQRIKAAIKAL